VDLPEARERAEALRNAFPGRDTLIISGATSEGTQALLNKMGQILQETAPKPVETPVIPILRPQGRDRIEVVLEDDTFVVSGVRAEVAALRLSETGDEGMDELQDRLKRMGLSRAMRRAGAHPGDRIRVGDVMLEWHG
jgi:GTP-binding protein